MARKMVETLKVRFGKSLFASYLFDTKDEAHASRREAREEMDLYRNALEFARVMDLPEEERLKPVVPGRPTTVEEAARAGLRVAAWGYGVARDVKDSLIVKKG